MTNILKLNSHACGHGEMSSARSNSTQKTMFSIQRLMEGCTTKISPRNSNNQQQQQLITV